MKLLHYLKDNALLISIMIVAAILRLYHLDFQSIWLDEIHTMIEANPALTLAEFDKVIMFREGIPHFYFLSVRLFFDIFGYSTYTARLFSVVVGVISVYAIYLLGRELFNKRAGLIAAVLLSVNHFHIYYSQEARSYALLLLFTILAFYRLVKFINNSNWKNALLFGLFSGLISHAHPIGLTVIIAQYLIVLFVLIKTAPKLRKRFFILSFASGILALVVFYPVYRIVSKVSDITSFWVPAPTPEVYSNIISEFLGKSELTLFIFNILFAFYAIRLFRQKLKSNSWEEIKGNKLIVSFLIFTAWASLAFLIPLIRSYLQIPMIVDRYFINILPVILLIFAIAIALIENKIVRYGIVISIVVLSMIDLFVVKDYYNRINKTQFREVTEGILKNNSRKDKAVSSFGWLMSYFLNKDTLSKPTIETTNFEDYITAMRNNAIPMESFWYLDGNERPYGISSEAEQFLADNFTLKKVVDKHDAWARHYVSKSEPADKTDIIDLNAFRPLHIDSLGRLMIFESGVVRSAIFSISKGKYQIIIKGISLPEKPINGENAHIKIKFNGIEIGNYSLSEKQNKAEKILFFDSPKKGNARITIIYDNDFALNGEDRNVMIQSIKLEKVSD